jgi:hypothetical protein
MGEHENNFGQKGCYGCAPCQPMHPLAQPVILACGQGASFDITPGETSVSHDAGYVQVDTTCLCKPLVKIDYSTNVYVDTDISTGLANDVVLTFTLQSICNGVTNTLDTFVYRRQFALNDSELGTIATQDSFCFTYCDQAYPGYCIYKVVVVATVGADVVQASVSGIHINAIAQ